MGCLYPSTGDKGAGRPGATLPPSPRSSVAAGLRLPRPPAPRAALPPAPLPALPAVREVHKGRQVLLSALFHPPQALRVSHCSHRPSGKETEVSWHLIICQRHTEPIKAGHRVGTPQPWACADPALLCTQLLRPGPRVPSPGRPERGFQVAGENCGRPGRDSEGSNA